MIEINENSIKLLRNKFKDDAEAIRLIQDGLLSFESYHSAIYRMESYTKLFDYENTEKEDYQAEFTGFDKTRTLCHNSVIANLKILNRLCERNSIPLIYDGELSENRPYRIEIADAVLTYTEEVVKNRLK